ncbi:membrane protein insertase YidC [Buchnera aphidicola]|uniref:Membrane protein insertase YidC, partial n=1 Tax=Buchnera aphidicola (Cinara strobi) TaxID=1921549 RepID=A0A3B1E7K3_9GAMM|nr:membrane protein insertase YidC [Buchnera aphidicola]VAX76197.1 Membrane protein insertase YidC [Buchnera aphidicola (Cinara strobi)]
MLKQYFLTFWISDFFKKYIFYSNDSSNTTSPISFISRIYHFFLHSCLNNYSNLSVRFNIKNQLSNVIRFLYLAMDYGWLFFFVRPLFIILTFFHTYLHNWGISIICVTIFIKILLYPLTKIQYMSMLDMKKIQLKVKKIKDQFNENDEQVNQKILKLYQSKKINPFYSLASMLIQAPIFLSFYYVLKHATELRQAPFCLWIKDLSSYDPYYVLPFLMGLSMFFIQYYELKDHDSSIKKNLLYMAPMLFSIFFIWFPSGLVLYYITSNICTLFQYFFIRESISNNSTS